MKYTLSIAVLLLSLLSTAPVRAEPTYKAGLMNFYPFAYKNDMGEELGPSYDFAEVVIRDAGLKADIFLLPMKRALNNISTGKSDLFYSYQIASLDKSVHWLGIVGCLNDLVVPLKTSGIRTKDGLKGKTITAGNGGYFHNTYAPENGIKTLVAPKYQTMFQLAVTKRADGISVNQAIYERFFIHEEDPVEGLAPNWRDMFAAPIRITQFPTSLSVSRNSSLSVEKDRLTEIVNNLRESGTFDSIMKRHHMSFQECDTDLQVSR